MFHKIFVASDLSTESKPVLRAALELARMEKAELVAAHVVAPWFEERHWQAPLFDEEVRVHRAVIQREKEAVAVQLGKLVEEVAAGAPLPKLNIMVATGSPADTIASAAADIGADLIVVGTRGRRETLGSVAERVVRIAQRPVLVVPAR